MKKQNDEIVEDGDEDQLTPAEVAEIIRESRFEQDPAAKAAFDHLMAEAESGGKPARKATHEKVATGGAGKGTAGAAGATGAGVAGAGATGAGAHVGADKPWDK